jgi:beta-aspartyl-peptidase (threonine type)
VLGAKGDVRMDASIMSGIDRAAGAVANLARVANPVSAARLVMERTEHVLLVAEAALALCEEYGLCVEDESYFITDFRKEQLEQAKQQLVLDPDHDDDRDDSLGTVGAVALDARGNLAAATSTGGITNQHPGRVGDSALIGAGTWADNETCAVSATGIGETIIRGGFAHFVDALVRLKGMPLEEACQRAVSQVVCLRGAAGCVAVDKHGKTAMPSSTPLMARGMRRTGSKAQVAIAAREPLQEAK